jgi:flagellar motor switch protein FliM
MQQQIQLGANSLESMLGAQGVSGASTENTQSLTNYENQATTQENAIAAQEYYNMWNDSQNREVSVLEGAAHDTATAEANKPDWMDYVTTGLEIAGAVAVL